MTVYLYNQNKDVAMIEKCQPIKFFENDVM